jgi:hypothetical protein
MEDVNGSGSSSSNMEDEEEEEDEEDALEEGEERGRLPMLKPVFVQK